MKTTLLIMAAGIGSRFGTGIKQLAKVDSNSHIIMDYSIHDAIEAGFNKIVFIIRRDMEEEFKSVIGSDNKGTSVVFVRTQKGQELFDSLKDRLIWKEVSYEEGVKGNPSEYKSVARSQQRDTFFEDLDKLSFEKMAKKYAADRKVPFKRRVVNKIKRKFKRIFGGAEKH